MKTLTRFRLSTILLLTAGVAVGLGWSIDHRKQQGNMAKAVELLRREAPCVNVAESDLPDWRVSTLAQDEFRLTVRRLIDESDQLIVILTIETLQPQWHSIWSRGTTWGVPSGGLSTSGALDEANAPEGYFSTHHTLTATQLSFHDMQFARMAIGGGSTTMEVPLKTSLGSVLRITAKGGVYSLHEPIVIGSACGVDLKLAVGDRAKVEAMSETATN